MRLRLASPSDFGMLRAYRARTFGDELGLQQSHYKDVFNDHFSKNIILESDGKLLGAVRLAFSRETQEFFISYLFMLPEHRSHSHSGLLLGAIFLLMRINGIQAVRADSADENLTMYTAAGCRIVGPRFKKYGFTCDWIPLMYKLGTNPETEERLISHAQAHLKLDANLGWHFVPTILSCSNIQEYRRVMNELIASGPAVPMVPHLTMPCRFGASFLENPSFLLARDHSGFAGEKDAFSQVNPSLNPMHRVVLGRGSQLRPVGEMYAYLTRKQVMYVDSWLHVPPEAVQGAQSILFLCDFKEAGHLIAAFPSGFQSCSWGVITGASAEEVSCALLENYFEFLGPAEHRVAMQYYGPGEDAAEQANGILSSLREETTGSRISSHAVLFARDNPGEAKAMLECLLCTGYTAGESVRYINLCFSSQLNSPLVLLGDPNLRFSPFQPKEIAEADGRSKTRFLCSPDNCAKVCHQQTQIAEERNSSFDAAFFEDKPYYHISCHDSGQLHSFRYSSLVSILPD